MAFFAPIFLAVQAANGWGSSSTTCSSPASEKSQIRHPLFIVGVPRSGTTFLHRLIAAHEDQFTTFRLWELIFAPSITQRMAVRLVARADRAIGRPLDRLLNRVQRLALGSLDDIHATKLQDPEEDYLALLPMGACFLLTLPFPFDELWQLVWFDDMLSDREKKRVMRYYRGIIQRHLYVHGPDRTYLSKNPSFSPMVRTLAAEFPDARFIGCFRHPEQAVPSLIHSMYGGARLFDNDLRGHGYRDELLSMLQHYYAHLLDMLPELPSERHTLVTLESMGPAPRESIHALFARFGWPVPRHFDAYLLEQDERAHRYRSSHVYALEDFDLDGMALRDLFWPVYERFGYGVSGRDELE